MKLLRTLGLSLAFGSAVALPALAEHPQYGQGSAILYAHPDFTGPSIRVTGPIARLNDYRFNDKVSSIRITGGAWEVCVDANFRGRCEVISYHEGRLNQIHLNDNISSIRPAAYGRGGRYDRSDRYHRHRGYDRGWGSDRGWDRDNRYDSPYGHRTQNAPVVLFRDPHFRGRALPLNGAVPHLNRLGFNDTVSSIAIKSGSWEVCTDPNFRGHCEIVTGSTSELGRYRLNDNITSIRPAGRHYGRRW